ncbi:MAG: NAD(P)/FAD-dependent oxidoreductase [Candidatus Limnocylindria bacterium]
MSDRDFDLIVLGGGPAGVTAALRAAELGARVALVERDRMGGTCTDDGCAPTRVLAQAARLLRDADQYSAYGLMGERPELDFPRLLARTQEAIYRIHEKKQLAAHLSRAGVEVHENAGTTAFVDPFTVELASGVQLTADRFVICVGGHARRLPIPGAELALTHSDVWRMERLPASVAIVGASATGVQLASVFDTFGSWVLLLEVAPRVLAGEDELVSWALTDAFERRGIGLKVGVGGIDRIESDDAAFRIAYRDGGERRDASVEAVILAVGWTGNLDDLDLEAAGVATERGFITVDESLRTSADHIFAAGDVTGRMMLVQSATFEARVAAENAIRGGGLRSSHALVPHGGFTDPEYASVGLPEHLAGDPSRHVVAAVPYAELDRSVIDGRTEGLAKLIVDRSGQILGAHVVGEQAVEIVQIVAVGMAAGMTVGQLAEMEFAYPTYTSILGLAARQVVHQLQRDEAADPWHALGRRPLAEWERRDLTTVMTDTAGS